MFFWTNSTPSLSPLHPLAPQLQSSSKTSAFQLPREINQWYESNEPFGKALETNSLEVRFLSIPPHLIIYTPRIILFRATTRCVLGGYKTTKLLHVHIHHMLECNFIKEGVEDKFEPCSRNMVVHVFTSFSYVLLDNRCTYQSITQQYLKRRFNKGW